MVHVLKEGLVHQKAWPIFESGHEWMGPPASVTGAPSGTGLPSESSSDAMATQTSHPLADPPAVAGHTPTLSVLTGSAFTFLLKE